MQPPRSGYCRALITCAAQLSERRRSRESGCIGIFWVDCLLSGPIGGDQQIGARLAEGVVDLLVFFWDPLEPQPHDPDVKALLRIAVVWNVPIACNRSSADFLISSPLLADDYDPTQPEYALARH